MAKENIVKRMWTLRAAALLLCLVLASTCLLSSMYGRFTTGVVGGSSARVATFRVSESGTLSKSLNLDIIPGTAARANLAIVNDSEVAIDYTVTVKNHTNNLKNLKMSINGTEGSATANGVEFSVQEQPGYSAQSFTLDFLWPEDTAAGTDTNLQYMGMLDYITVTVVATQID